MKTLIGISGKIGSGKDTVAHIIQLLSSDLGLSDQTIAHLTQHPSSTVKGSTWGIRKFAGKLKEVASILTGIPTHRFEDQEFKKTYLGPEWNTWYPNIDRPEQMTVREFLQKLGTEAMRNGLHRDTWVNATFANYKPYVDKWLITDTRFPNEAAAVKERGGVLLRVNRNASTGDHPSETALDNYEFDYVIENDGDLTSLVTKVRAFCYNYQLLQTVTQDFPDHSEGFY